MKIEKLHIENFRSIETLALETADILALVGRNNSGKSNILKALEFFFEASPKLIDRDSFYQHDETKTIKIYVTFGSLSDSELSIFGAWLKDDKLIVGREVSVGGEEKYQVSTVAVVTVPEPEWLQEAEISGEKITDWWSRKAELKINGLDFAASLPGGAKPKVGDWKEAARVFVRANKDKIPHVDKNISNPKGYPNVLKGSLPEFILVPAVRDVTDETKVLKTNPFGKLMAHVLEQVPEEEKTTIKDQLDSIALRLNRSDDNTQRISAITQSVASCLLWTRNSNVHLV